MVHMYHMDILLFEIFMGHTIWVNFERYKRYIFGISKQRILMRTMAASFFASKSILSKLSISLWFSLFEIQCIYKCFTDGRLMLQAAHGLSISCFLLLWYLARAHIVVPWLKIAILTSTRQSNHRELTCLEWILVILIAWTALYVE